MFRKNEPPREPGPSSIQQQLPKKLRERLENSWAPTFRDEVFYRIDEEPFAVLYSDRPSRPNAPVNVLVGMDILKAGFGWSDKELYDHVCFDLQVRHALALDGLGSSRSVAGSRPVTVLSSSTPISNRLPSALAKAMKVMARSRGWMRALFRSRV